MLGDKLAALRFNHRSEPQHVCVRVDDRRDVLVCIDDACLLAHRVLRHQQRIALVAGNLE